MKTNFQEWISCAGVRAIRTFAQVAVSMLTVGQAFTEINWLNIVSVAATAAIISVLMGLAGLPETASDGTLNVDTSATDKDIYQLAMEQGLDGLSKKKRVIFKVNPKAKIIDGKVVE